MVWGGCVFQEYSFGVGFGCIGVDFFSFLQFVDVYDINCYVVEEVEIGGYRVVKGVEIWCRVRV